MTSTQGFLLRPVAGGGAKVWRPNSSKYVIVMEKYLTRTEDTYGIWMVRGLDVGVGPKARQISTPADKPIARYYVWSYHHYRCLWAKYPAWIDRDHLGMWMVRGL